MITISLLHILKLVIQQDWDRLVFSEKQFHGRCSSPIHLWDSCALQWTWSFDGMHYYELWDIHQTSPCRYMNSRIQSIFRLASFLYS